MSNFKAQNSNYYGIKEISGDNLLDAISNHKKDLLTLAKLNEWCGKRQIVSATLAYNSGVLGGRGGAELIAVRQNFDDDGNAHGNAFEGKVWIYADQSECPESILDITDMFVEL